MASSQQVQEGPAGGAIGAAAAFAAADRRRAQLCDQKAAWLAAFAEFKLEETRRSDAFGSIAAAHQR